MTRAPSWRAVLAVFGSGCVSNLLAATGHPAAALVIGLAVIPCALVLIGWALLYLALDMRAYRRGRRGHPDEEAAIRAARLHLGIRNGGTA